MQWNDLDYADKKRVFTFDPQRFGDLPEMVQEFHEQGLKYVLIVVSGLVASEWNFNKSVIWVVYSLSI